jgi:uncharacterized membrane protein YeaQ/YmgE (transglycosylase-associated protein family)
MDTPNLVNPKPHNYNLLATVISGVIIGAALIVLAYIVGPDRSVYPITYLICICGYLLGWIVAIVSTPMNKRDEDGLGKFTKMIGTFLGGYVLSKCDKLIENLVDPSQATPMIGARVILFICCFALTFILVFYYREYKWSVK